MKEITFNQRKIVQYIEFAFFVFFYSCSGDTTVVKKRPQKIVVNTYELNFSTVVLSEKKSLELGVSNVGDLPLDLIAVTIVPSTSPFTVTNSVRRIESGKTEKFIVIFSPQSEGMHNANLNIVSNDPENEVIAVKLLGIGSTVEVDSSNDAGDTQENDTDTINIDDNIIIEDDTKIVKNDDIDISASKCTKVNEKKVITVQNTIREIDSVWFKNEIVIVWRDEDQNIYFLAVSPEGVANENEKIIIKESGNPVSNVRISAGDNTIAVMYEEAVNTDYLLQMSFVENKVVKTNKTITTYPSSFQDPPLIWVGDSYAIAWHFTKDGNKNVFISLVDEDGNITKDMVNATNAQNPKIANFPSLGYANDNIFVLYSAYDGTAYYPVPDLFLIKGSKNNLQFQSPLKKPPIKNKIVGSDRQLIWSGKEFGFFWSETELHTTSTTQFTKQYYFQQLDENGSNINDLIVLEDLSNKNADYAKMIFNGNNFAVAYKIEGDILLRIIDLQLKIANTEYIVANFNDTLESVDLESAKQNDFIVIWLMKDSSAKKQIYISRICK